MSETKAKRALSSVDGKTWEQGGFDADGSALQRKCAWPKWEDFEVRESVVKLVVGELKKEDASGEWSVVIELLQGKFLADSRNRTISDYFPNLAHLYIWNLEALLAIRSLPGDLEVLDVRGGSQLNELATLPETLEELVLWDCPNLDLKGDRDDEGFHRLVDCSLRIIGRMDLGWFEVLLKQAPLTRMLEIQGCENLTHIPCDWPEGLVDLRLNDNGQLKDLPKAWPKKLRRLELEGSQIRELPKFGSDLDYVNLGNTNNLTVLPKIQGSPRTLLIHGSGLHLRDEFFGDPDFNSAKYVLAHLERDRVPDHDVKVILLGNGRCGKSSLARRLVDGVFDPEEKSTHGIRLWHLDQFAFEPVDAQGTEAFSNLRIWDFAGQDLYHHTHRLFYQSKAIFIICDTASGDGADPESDGINSDDLPPGWDEDRRVDYWRDQVESLGSSPGREGPPPMLFVRTKADRDHETGAVGKISLFWQERKQAVDGLDHIDFGACSGSGLDDLQGWLRIKVSEVLGELGRREMRADAMEVKRTLQKRIEENDKEHLLAENEDRPAKPPHPFMERSEFEVLVKQHCKDSRYADEPEIFLNLLHQGGTVFYSKEFLPFYVILDQRWAINGIYTAFDRKESWRNLVSTKGRCTLQDLQDWGWSRGGYSQEEQALFVGLMDRCGMMFGVGQREGGRPDFLVPRALPSIDADIQREASDYRDGVVLNKTVDLKHKSLSRAAVMDLLVSLGRDWGRAPLLWLWGGQFESYRYYRGRDDERRTFVFLNWTPERDGSFGGHLQIDLYGPDESFLAAVLEQCEKIGGFSQVDVPVIDLPEEDETLKEGRLPGKEIDSHSAKGESLFADCLEVGISFAGDQKGGVEDWKMLPEDSIERWPLALASHLRAMRISVEEYRTEQGRDVLERTHDRDNYLNKLLSKDFIYSFLSWPYLESPWCMAEFLRLRQKCGGKFDPACAWVASFQDAYLSQGDLDQIHGPSGKRPLVHFTDYWREKRQKFEDLVEDETACEQEENLTAREKVLEQYPFKDWMLAIADGSIFPEIKKAIKGGWPVKKLPNLFDQSLVESWADELEKVARRREVLLCKAEEAEAAGQRERAKRFFIKAIFAGDPDGQPDGLKAVLKRKLGVEKLDNIRRALAEDLEDLLEEGHVVDRWQDLEALVVSGSES